MLFRSNVLLKNSSQRLNCPKKIVNKKLSYNEVTMNDQQLLILLQNSPSKGLAKAIDLYGDSVRWIACKILGLNNSEDIEECVSDIFVRFWQSLERFDSTSNVPLKSYLYGIARHTALDYQKQKKSILLVPLEEDDLSLDVDFTGELAKKTNLLILHDVIENMPSPDQEIFIRRYFLEERIKTIAGELHLPEKMVENKLYRGKMSLKQQLIERGFII